MRQLAWLTALAASLSAQTLDRADLTAGGVCAAGTDFSGYRIAHARVEDPFRFLYWISGQSRTVGAQLTAKLEGQPYSLALVREGLALVEQARFAPDNQAAFSIRFERALLENCDAAAKTLDVVYRIYSTDPPRFLGGAVESQQTAQTSPQTTTGLTETGNPLHFTPAGGYNRSDGAFGGGRIEVHPRHEGFPLFDTFVAEGEGSYSMRKVSAALAGSANWRGWVQHAVWRLDYRNRSLPAGAERLKQGSLSGSFDAATRPFWNGALAARAGALLEGGNQQSAGAAALLPAGTLAGAAYGSLKTYAGLTSRTGHNVLSVSYGLQLGSVGPSTRADWRKHVGDVNDEFWIPLADHKPFEVETRATFGGIQTIHEIPLPERFFGGNGEQYFLPGDDWQIPAQPSIRAIPADRFYLTAAGAGADRFASVNLTLSYPVKSRPIMPKALSADREVQELLNAQIVSAASVDQNYYTWKDPHFAAAYARLPQLNGLLDTLSKAVNAAQAAHPNQLADAFADCTTNLAVAQWDVTNALRDKGIGQYGSLSALLPAGSNDLQSVDDACVGEVNRQIGDPAIGAAASAVAGARAGLLADFQAIDQKLAARKAANDMAFVRRTLNTLFRDVNLFSVSPVAVFDSAWIGPAKGPLGGNRIGPGGGIRLAIASAVNFTLGYACNVERRPGEGAGALFFSIGVRDLFH